MKFQRSLCSPGQPRGTHSGLLLWDPHLHAHVCTCVRTQARLCLRVTYMHVRGLFHMACLILLGSSGALCVPCGNPVPAPVRLLPVTDGAEPNVPLSSVQHNTMESLLERGEKLDDLVSKSEVLGTQSKAFYKTVSGCCPPPPALPSGGPSEFIFISSGCVWGLCLPSSVHRHHLAGGRVWVVSEATPAPHTGSCVTQALSPTPVLAGHLLRCRPPVPLWWPWLLMAAFPLAGSWLAWWHLGGGDGGEGGVKQGCDSCSRGLEQGPWPLFGSTASW